MSRTIRTLPEIFDAAEVYPLDEAIEKYNELIKKTDRDTIPVLMIRTENVPDESDEEVSIDGVEEEETTSD